MRLNKMLGIVVLLFTGVQGSLFTQFKIIPKLELNITFDNMYQSLPNEITLIGKGDHNFGKVYTFNISKSKRKYIMYNVKPGKYLVTFTTDSNEEQKNLEVTHEFRIVYNHITLETNYKYIIPSMIEIKDNRNFKLDLIFKLQSPLSVSGFVKAEEINTNDYDYTKIIYYKRNLLINPVTDQHNQEREGSNGSSCGGLCRTCENGCKCEMDVNITCQLLEGKIVANIKKVKYTHNGNNIVTDGTAGVGTFEDGQTERTMGKVRVESAVVCPKTNEEENNEIKCYSAKCDEITGLCKDYILNYDVDVTLTTYIWDKSLMCETVEGYLIEKNNKCYLCDLRKHCACNCFFKMVKEHEQTHCELWLKEAQTLKDVICVEIKKYEDQIGFEEKECCCEQNGVRTCSDETCETYAKQLWDTVGDLIRAPVSNIYSEENGATQENACDDAELTYMRSCIRSCIIDGSCKETQLSNCKDR